MVFLEKDGFDVAFFVMYISEYFSLNGKENETYISLLDSVQYFEHDGLRTKVYYSIIINYLKYARYIG